MTLISLHTLIWHGGNRAFKPPMGTYRQVHEIEELLEHLRHDGEVSFWQVLSNSSHISLEERRERVRDRVSTDTPQRGTGSALTHQTYNAHVCPNRAVTHTDKRDKHATLILLRVCARVRVLTGLPWQRQPSSSAV